MTMPAGVGALYASCGTVLATLRDKVQTTWDVLANKAVVFTQLRRPVCSADRSEIIGINSNGQLATNRGLVIEEAGQFGSYSISPSGAMTAFIRPSTLEVCIGAESRTRRCYRTDPLNNGGASVDDRGYTLFVQLIAKTCYYYKGRLSERRLPGSSSDQCFASSLATPDGSPQMLVLLGTLPAWYPDKF